MSEHNETHNTLPAGLVDRVEDWLDQDPDPETRAELTGLLDAASAGSRDAEVELQDRFDRRLSFGTAGLRGTIAAGPNRMNRVLVAQAAAGLATYLLTDASERADAADADKVDANVDADEDAAANADSDSDASASASASTGNEVATEQPSLSLVIGYDGRRNSRVFAEDSAAIIAGAGIRAILLPRLLPTPVLAFAVRHLDADAGIMVTASHNPPNDNGYKVYLGGESHGSQIVAPADARIADEILAVAASRRVPDLPRGDYEIADESVIDAYVERTAAVATRRGHDAATASHTAGGSTRPGLSVVYTAMHGVGWETMSRVLHAAGFAQPHLVSEQIEPDAAFPTVAFPNPEEPGAMDLAFEHARATGADLVIANDPDADRLAIAIPDANYDGGYRQLTGNEIGIILGWRAADAAAAVSGDGGAEGTLACSIVSSPALGAIAAAYGLNFADTLTGFKWISRAPGIIFGYEEALGYLVNPETVRDKDGISAALAMLELASDLAAEGHTLADHLDAFTERFGHYASAQISVRVTDVARIAEIMATLRADPPIRIGRLRVERIEDLADGYGELPPSDVLRIIGESGARVMVRPSGTEPKLKVYIDAVSTEGDIAERRAAATSTVAELERGMRALIE